MKSAPQPSPAAAAAAAVAAGDPVRLAEAFRLFNEASEQLSIAYGGLEQRIEALTAELAAANAERQRLREEAERNARLAAMGEMAAQLAHQLRTPLAAALLYAGNLENPDLPTDKRVAIAQKTVLRLQHLERLIQDILLFARGEVLGREHFTINELLDELQGTFEPLARQRQVELQVTRSDDKLALTGNRKALSGALTSLLENALQAVAAGGSIRVDVSAAAAQLQFRVRDNGAGMAPEVASRLFEPFFTTRSDGTGLGLAIAHGVARAHGGSISVDTRPGEGSLFTLSVARGGDASPAMEPVA